MTNITGTESGDLLFGTSGDDLILGLGGDDRILGEAGNDTIDGGDGNDSITGGDGTDNIQGGAGDDNIDITTNDTIDGGAGNDILSVDLFSIPVLTGINFNHQNFSFSFFETLFTSTIINVEAVGFFRLTNFDDVVFYGPAYTFFVNIRGQNGNDTITGGAGSNSIFGEGGNDILIGGSGSNRFDGGAGNDTITGNSTNDTFTIEDGTGAVTINVVTGVATGTTSGTDQFSGIERFNVFAGSIDFTGDDQANIIQASAAIATLRGGNGNDIYLIQNSRAVIIETASGGTADQVFAQSDYVLPDNVENLAFATGTRGNFSLTGNGLNNVIRGNIGNNILRGGDGNDQLDGDTGDDIVSGDAGADRLDGGNGLDTASYASSSASVTINLATNTASGGDAAGDTLISIESITGSAFADTLTGSSGDNVIEGGAGDDVLDGGAGIDTVSYASSVFGVTVHLDNLTAQNTVQQGIDTISGFENILGSGADDVLFGDAASNVITAGGGFDTLVSGGGTNTLIGGTGGDIYFVQGVNDIVTEGVGGGYDIVLSQVNFSLAAGSEVEALAVNTTAGISLTGNEFGQNLTGNAGNDTLSGGGGNDLIISGGGTNTLIGGTGSDIYYAQGLNDVVTEDAGGGFDVVLAGGNLTLAASSEVEVIAVNTASGVTIIGSDIVQTILGGAGNDRLIGARGNDTLVGSGGADTFVLLNTFADRDFVLDFASGTDKLEISASLFGGGLAAGVLSASQFLSGAGTDIATTAAQRFIYNSSTGNLWFDADGSGAGASVLMANLSSVPTLTAADFLIAV